MVKEIIVCPNCGSPRIDYASLRKRSGAILGLGVPEQYYCLRCGYVGSVVVSIPRDKLKKVKFKPKQIKKIRTEKTAEILEPVFVGVVLIFLVLAIFLLIPKYDIIKETEVSLNFTPQQMGSVTSIVYVPPPTQIEENGGRTAYGTYWVIRNASISNIDRAFGYENVLGFLTPFFFLFFVLGFLILMIYSHWHRINFFQQ